MPIHLRAYVVVMILGYAAQLMLRKVFVPAGLHADDFDRRRKVWFLVTSAAYFSGNFWIFAIACAVLVVVWTRKETNEMALFVALVFAVPPISKVIPGIGPLEYLIPLTHERILTFCILVPVALKLFKERADRARGARFPDVMVGLYIAYLCILSFANESLQSAMRSSLYALLDIGAIYYVASRSTRTLERFREVIIALLVALAIVALVSVFESLRSWWVYDALRVPFGEPGGGYHTRGDLNLLRAQVTLGHPIILGLAMGLGLMLQLSVGARYCFGHWRIAMMVLFVAGCLMPFSRGPWVGTVAGAMILVFSGPGRGKRFGYASLAALVAIAGLSFTKFGQSVYGLLPFVGNKSVEGSAAYREQLWDVSLEVWRKNLLFGDLNYIRDPLMEVMRQGEGIIDMVNSYLQIGLAYGLVAVVLFAGCAIACWSSTSVSPSAKDDERATLLALQRGLRACIITLLVTMATVSSIGLLPAMLWTIFGLSAGLSRLGIEAPSGNRLRRKAATGRRPAISNMTRNPA